MSHVTMPTALKLGDLVFNGRLCGACGDVCASHSLQCIILSSGQISTWQEISSVTMTTGPLFFVLSLAVLSAIQRKLEIIYLFVKSLACF